VLPAETTALAGAGAPRFAHFEAWDSALALYPERASTRPRSMKVNTPLRIPHSHGINNHVESSVWLAGRLCATLVARPASKV
jgi:hypothetical protein